MSVARLHTWIAGEVLLASDLNSEFNNILNNGTAVAFPLTAAVSMGGFALNFDAANTIALTAATNGLSLTGGAFNTPQGSDVASAATVNLDTATGNTVDVTGTVTWTAVTLAQGRWRLVRHTGAQLLTNGASLVLVGGANITTASGDYSLFVGYAAGVVRQALFMPAVAYLKLTGGSITGTVTITGPINESKTTVASATTPDIWTSVGNFVDYTGTVTATGFAAAPQAGSRRTLLCAAAAPFTAGANLLIQGYASGNTFTAAAGDQIDVVAITTTQFRITIRSNAGTPVVGTSIPRSYLAGLTLSTAGASTTMTTAAGQATDSTNAAVMTLASATGKTTASWAVGSGNGGLDTGAIANATWYHFYVITRLDTGVVDVLFSVNASAPTMPTNYTLKRRIGSGLTNGSGQWILFIQYNDDFYWSTPVLDINANNPGTSAVSRTLTSTPLGVKVKALLNIGLSINATSTYLYLSSLDTADIAVSSTAAPLGQLSETTASGVAVGYTEVYTDTSQAIRSRLNSSDASTNVRITTLGWQDRRGRDA